MAPCSGKVALHGGVRLLATDLMKVHVCQRRKVGAAAGKPMIIAGEKALIEVYVAGIAGKRIGLQCPGY